MANAGVFLVQPSAVVAVGLVAGCFLLAGSRGRARAALVGACGWVLTTAALVLPWLLGSLTHAQVTLDFSRPGQLPYLDGIYQLLVQYRGMTPAPTLPVLLAVAVVVLLVGRTHRWLVAATDIFGILFLVALAAASPLRQLLTGFWYTDWYRLGGIFWLLAVLVVLAALDTVLRGLRSGPRDRASRPSRSQHWS